MRNYICFASELLQTVLFQKKLKTTLQMMKIIIILVKNALKYFSFLKTALRKKLKKIFRFYFY
jgi:hypothetical protein